MLAAHFGVFAQLTGGITVRVAGYDDSVEMTLYDDRDDVEKRTSNGRVRPDLRFAFGLVF
jgi:hypothetical protein